MALDRLVPGAQYTLRFAKTSGDDPVPSSRRCLLVLDAPEFPAGPSPARLTLEYLPGGGDPGTSADGDDVLFVLSPDFTAQMGARSGVWSVYILVGDETVQDAILAQKTSAVLTVERPPDGVLPHA